MTADADGFDLSAAWKRRAEGDFQAFMEAFAARMEGAFPGQVKVERRRDGLFSSSRHVHGLSVDLGQYAYALAIDRNARLTATRRQTIRGITLKSEEMTVPDWLASLNRELAALADHAGSARTVLHDFLMS